MSISDGPAILFDLVSKTFPRHAGRLLLRDRLMQLLPSHRSERFQALHNISFLLSHGESVALIGHNGAGKSTILNLATHLCRPDSGRVEIHGRVAALLDLGAGFHPDLTGAENVRINASILGLTRRQMRQKYDEIIAFAEVGDFINEPLRTYSSGMSMRLAFAVAVCVDPDILIIDEVLGVGDLAFFTKCQRRIQEFRQAGKTILCVSHSTSTLLDLCGRAIWLDHGHVLDDGPIAQVLARYKAAMSPQAAYSAG